MIGVKQEPANYPELPEDIGNIGFLQVPNETDHVNAWVDLETFDVTYQVEQEHFDEEAPARRHRNALLAECDWTQLPDSPLSAEEKASWADYRKALRDLPNHPEWPYLKTWPVIN